MPAARWSKIISDGNDLTLHLFARPRSPPSQGPALQENRFPLFLIVL
jgi:hypothetical protein